MIDSRLALLGKTADVPGAVQQHKAGRLNNLLRETQIADIPIARDNQTRQIGVAESNANTQANRAMIEYETLLGQQDKAAIEEGLRTAKQFTQIKSQGDLDIWRANNPIDAEAAPTLFDSPEFADAFRGSEMMVNASLNPQTPDRTLVEVADETSPTGTRFVKRSDAVNQPGKPGSQTSLTTNPDGSVTFTQGRGAPNATQNGLDKATNRKIEGQKFDAIETLSRINRTERAFKPEFLEVGTRADALWSTIKEKSGVELSDNEKQQLTEYSEFKQAAFSDMNLTMNILSGAAVSDQEFARMTQALPNAGAGLFDGDSPTVFKSKMEAVQRDQKRAIMRYNYALKNNQDPLSTGIELSDVDALYDRRGEEIEGIMRQENPNISDDVLELEVRARLKQEFGM